MTSRRGPLAIAGSLLLLTGTSGALAATPESGEVSKANPKVTWTGEVANSYFNRIPVLLTEDDTFPCLPTMCDMFALKVAESDDLTITADAPESTSQTGDAGSQVTLRIRKPDGSVTVHSTDTPGATPEKPLVVKIKKAEAGDWEIEYFNYFYGGAIEYNGSATLGTPAAAPAVAPPTTAPGPPAQEDLQVTVKASGQSARKLKKSRRLSATVTVSRPVEKVTATLKKGKSVIGKGSLGPVQDSARLTVRLAKKAASKLKKGTYSLTVAATDGAGTTGIRTVKVKVRK